MEENSFQDLCLNCAVKLQKIFKANNLEYDI